VLLRVPKLRLWLVFVPRHTEYTQYGVVGANTAQLVCVQKDALLFCTCKALPVWWLAHTAHKHMYTVLLAVPS